MDADAYSSNPASRSQDSLLIPTIPENDNITVNEINGAVHYGNNFYAPIHGSNVGGKGNVVNNINNINNYHSAVDTATVILLFASSCL